MGVYVYAEGRSRSAEHQIWEHLDRMHNAGPVADAYLAAQERQAWASGTGRAAPPGISMSVAMATVGRRWIGTRLTAVGRWLAGVAPEQTVADDRFVTIQRRLAS